MLGRNFVSLRIVVWFVVWLMLVKVSELCRLVLMFVKWKGFVCMMFRNFVVVIIGFIVWDDEGLMFILNILKIERNIRCFYFGICRSFWGC